jgi:hypothetical protein
VITMLLITVGRYFPTLLGTEKIYCPHDKCVRVGEQRQFTVMVGLFYIPILPAARVKEWRCTNCNGRVVPNEGGKHSKQVLLFSSVVAVGGFLMFALFAYWAFSIGGKGSAFNPENLNVAKGMLGFFALMGLCIVMKALLDARRIARTLSEIVALSPEQMSAIQAAVEPGDDDVIVATKLVGLNLSNNEIKTYTESWCKPEA